MMKRILLVVEVDYADFMKLKEEAKKTRTWKNDETGAVGGGMNLNLATDPEYFEDISVIPARVRRVV